MNIALVQPFREHHNQILDCHAIEPDITLELGNVAHGLKFFADQLKKTRSTQARFAKVVQLKTWALNKPTIETLLEQYLDQVTQTQKWLHLDPQNHDLAIESLCEQLLFLSAVFEQESQIIDQMVIADPQLVLCD